QDGRTDQYALGVVAYQLYSGHLPFEVADVDLLCNAVLNYQPERIENVPKSVNKAIQRAMAKDRKGRFELCRAFVEALSKAATSDRKGCFDEFLWMFRGIMVSVFGVGCLGLSYLKCKGNWWQILADECGRIGVWITFGILIGVIIFFVNKFVHNREMKTFLMILSSFVLVGLGILLLWGSYESWCENWQYLFVNLGFWSVCWGIISFVIFIVMYILGVDLEKDPLEHFFS
ncbi:MAG: hypothetical protein ACI4UF_06140, partial [Thermoguttaceae bacterium]